MDAWRVFVALISSREAYRRPVIPLLIVFSAGLVCGERFFLPRSLSGVIIGICLGGVLLSIIRKQSFSIIPFILFLFLGWFSMTGFAFPELPDNHVARLAGETFWTITGTIIDEPVFSLDRRHLFLKTRWAEDGRSRIRAAGNLRVTVYGAVGPALPYGAVIRFQSRIREINNFRNPGGFDYKRHLAFQKVFGLAYAYADRVEVLPTAGLTGWRPLVETAREKIAGHIDRSGSGVRTGILKALVIGRRSDLDPAVREAFSRAGVSHLLAISGLHVGIVAGLVFLTLSRLLASIPFLTWRGWVGKIAAAGTLPGVVAYGLLAGMSPSTQRAVIMAAVFLAAMMVDRRPQLLNTLALAALVILAAHPPSLYAVSFQLSFAAVFFIISGVEAVENLLGRLKSRWARRGAGFMLVSFFAIAGTSPLTAYYFNTVSWAGLPANCFMIPLVGFLAVPLGLGGAVVYGVSPALSLLLFKADGVIIALAYAVIEKMAALPGVAIKTVTPSVFELGCYYVLLWALLLLIKHDFFSFIRQRDDRPVAMTPVAKGALIMATIAVVCLAADTGWWINRRWFHDDLRITVLEVGQGNAALLELPGGKCLMIDGGGFTGSSTFDVGKMIVAPFLWRHKIGAVDTLILTHPDTDHISGLVYIADHFNVKTVWSNGEAVDTDDYRRFIEMIEKRGVDRPDFKQLEKSVVINGVRFEFLYPPEEFMSRGKHQSWRNTNNNSLVIRVSLGQASFLFAGDLMKEAETELAAMAGESLASTVLMAPHHGSKTSGTSFFLSLVRPEVVVISAGVRNRYGYPHAEALKRYALAGADIYRTDIHGAVVMSTTGNGLRVKTPLAGK